jgi:3-isopropylmalate dehydrogenase
MARYKIAYIPGDGSGPELMIEGLKVLREIQTTNLSFELIECEAGAEVYKEKGRAVPQTSWEIMEESDCIYKAPVGLPGVVRPDGVEAAADVIIGMRSKFDLYVNLRPITLFEGVQSPLSGKKPGSINYAIVRENTEDLYVMQGGILRDEIATNIRIITRKGSERVSRYGFELSKNWACSPLDRKRRVTCVESSKVLVSDKFFARVFDEVAQEYPNIETTHEYVDAFAQSQVLRPEFYHVVVTPNFHGDILSDLAGATTGGIGLIAGGNIGEEKAMFEPIHGSAPTLRGKGVANPIAMIMAAKMMLEWIGKKHYDTTATKASDTIEYAVRLAIKEGSVKTPDLGGNAKTSDVGDAVIHAIRNSDTQ